MKDSEKIWLLEEFPKYKGKTIRGEIANAYHEAERILNNKQSINKRTCGCQYRSLAEGVNRAYDKWLQNEKDIHNK